MFVGPWKYVFQAWGTVPNGGVSLAKTIMAV